MIYSIIMLSHSHKTHKVPSTESKTHTCSCFPLPTPISLVYTQYQQPFSASVTQRNALAGCCEVPIDCTLHVMPLGERRAGKPPADAEVPATQPGGRGLWLCLSSVVLPT